MSVYSTIESTHGRILDKITIIKKAIDELRSASNTFRDYLATMSVLEQVNTALGTNIVNGICNETPFTLLDSLQLNLIQDLIESTDNEYVLVVAHVLGNYYSASENESKNTKEYYRIITSENISGRLTDVLRICDSAVGKLNRAIQMGSKITRGKKVIANTTTANTIIPNTVNTTIPNTVNTTTANNTTANTTTANTLSPKEILKSIEDAVYMVTGDLTYARSLDISEYLEKRNNELCKCGARLQLMPETSELRCDSCFKTKKVVGSVLRDDQYSGHEGQKSKHSGYDIIRHLRFWLERLQALETKTFDDDVIALIAYVIKRDGFIKTELTCEIMRSVLKDPHVSATYLNDHAPLLVKKFGGDGPPTLDYHETKIIHIRFIRAMTLYDQINPLGGNKPYYPHFIYKIIEELFKDNPEKLRILNYIHLQSIETIEKNDRYYEQICEMIGDAESGLVYTPTDPSGRL